MFSAPFSSRYNAGAAIVARCPARSISGFQLTRVRARFIPDFTPP